MSNFDDMIDVLDLMERLGIENARPASGGAEVNFPCPWHDDHRPSAFMNATTTAHWCHSCKFRGRDCLNFVQRILGVTETETLTFLMEHYGIDFQEPMGGDLVAEIRSILEPSAIKADPFRAPSPSWLETMTHDLWSPTGVEALAYARGRGLEDDVLRAWDFGYDVFSNRLVVAVRDLDSELIGFKGRRIDEIKEHKYDVLGDTRGTGYARYGFDTYAAASVVFGLDRNRTCRTVVVLEGELDAAALSQWGVERPVGLGMSYLSDAHAAQLIAEADHVIFFLDPDKAGTDALTDSVRRVEPYCSVSIVQGHLDDPLKMGREQTLYHLGQARSTIDIYLDRLLVSR